MSSEPDGGILIGVGHAERQDDGVGPYVARELARRGLPAIVHEGDGTGLLDLWQSRPACIVVDAVTGAGAPGTLRAFTDFDHPDFLCADFVHSTHRLGVPEAIALGRTLERLPARLLVVGVTGAAFGFGDRLSPQVALAADRLIDWLADAADPFDAGIMSGFELA